LIYSTRDTGNNPQDQFGGLPLFNPSTPVGTRLELRPNSPINGQSLNYFPQGTPLLLVMRDGTQLGRFTTGDIHKDIGGSFQPIARVSYGSDNTALISFPSGGGAFDFRVSMGNVTGAAAGGCSM
jgi:hypothetical protein